MSDRERSSVSSGRGTSPPASGAARNSGVHLVGTGIAPVAPDDTQPTDVGRDVPQRKGNFQKRVQEEVEHTLQEHPDGSAPPLDRLTQDLDPNKDL
jgi:hypothetical protein